MQADVSPLQTGRTPILALQTLQLVHYFPFCSSIHQGHNLPPLLSSEVTMLAVYTLSGSCRAHDITSAPFQLSTLGKPLVSSFFRGKSVCDHPDSQET